MLTHATDQLAAKLLRCSRRLSRNSSFSVCHRPLAPAQRAYVEVARWDLTFQSAIQYHSHPNSRKSGIRLAFIYCFQNHREDMALKRIEWLLTENILDPRQTGFRAHLSTHDSLLLIRDHYSCSEVWQPKNSCCHRHQKGFRLCPALSHQKGISRRTLAFVRSFQSRRSVCVNLRRLVCVFPLALLKYLVISYPRSNSRRTIHQPAATLGYYHPDGARRSQAVLWMFCAKSHLCLFGTRGVSNQS